MFAPVVREQIFPLGSGGGDRRKHVQVKVQVVLFINARGLDAACAHGYGLPSRAEGWQQAGQVCEGLHCMWSQQSISQVPEIHC